VSLLVIRFILPPHLQKALLLLQRVIQFGEGIAQFHSIDKALEPFYGRGVTRDILCQRGDIPWIIIEESRLNQRRLDVFLEQLTNELATGFALFHLQPPGEHLFLQRFRVGVLLDIDTSSFYQALAEVDPPPGWVKV